MTVYLPSSASVSSGSSYFSLYITPNSSTEANTEYYVDYWSSSAGGWRYASDWSTGLTRSIYFSATQDTHYVEFRIRARRYNDISGATWVEWYDVPGSYHNPYYPDPITIYPPSNASPSATATSVTITFSPGSGCSYTSATLYTLGGSYISSQDVYGSSVSYSGLSSGTSYYCQMYSVYSTGTSGAINVYFATRPQLQPPTNCYAQADRTTATVYFTKDPNAYGTVAKLYDTRDWSLIRTIKTAFDSAYFANLTPGVAYRADLYCASQDESDVSSSVYVNFTTSTRPEDFAGFNFTQGQQMAYTKVGGIIYATIMPYTEWNSFTSKINEFRVWKNESAYPFTQAVSGAEFTDSYYRQAVDVINAFGFSLPQGHYFTAACFINLKNAINSL